MVSTIGDLFPEGQWYVSINAGLWVGEQCMASANRGLWVGEQWTLSTFPDLLVCIQCVFSSNLDRWLGEKWTASIVPDRLEVEWILSIVPDLCAGEQWMASIVPDLLAGGSQWEVSITLGLCVGEQWIASIVPDLDLLAMEQWILSMVPDLWVGELQKLSLIPDLVEHWYKSLDLDPNPFWYDRNSWPNDVEGVTSTSWWKAESLRKVSAVSAWNMDEYDGGNLPATITVEGSALGLPNTVVTWKSLGSEWWQHEHQYLYTCWTHSMIEPTQQHSKTAPTKEPTTMAAMSPVLSPSEPGKYEWTGDVDENNSERRWYFRVE